MIWLPGPPRPLAPLGEVHLWRADLDDGSRDADALVWLCSDDERTRATDMRDPAARRRFVVGRALHRLLVGGYAVGNHRIELRTTRATLGGAALFAFGRTHGLGASIVPLPDGDPSVARLPGLTNRERLGIRALSPADRARTAAAVLAAKEALGHARGRGLDDEIAAVEVLPRIVEREREQGRFALEHDGIAWSGCVLDDGGDRVGCVVHDGGPRALRAWHVGA